MRNIAFGALMAGLLVACGGGGKSNPDAPTIVTTDAGFDAPPAAVCDPVKQSGCDAGQKCTWIRIQATSTSQVGQLGCVPDGTVALNGSCVWGAAGSATGYDNCVKGNICLASSRTDKASGTCLGICDVTALAGAAGACATNYACGRYSNFFENAGDPSTSVGLCDPTCNPLTQTRDYDTAAHCGGPLDANNQPTLGCIGLPSSDATPSQFTCGRVLDPTKVGDTFAYDATLGGVYLNSCAAGYIPLLYDNTADAKAQNEMKVICVAYCQPAPTSTTTPLNAGGMPNSGHTCTDAGTGGTHECRYWWFLESSMTPVSNASNNVGYCFDYTQYSYDGTGLHPPRTATEADPSCKTLSDTLKTFDAGTGGTQTVPDNIFWGCGLAPTAFTGGNAKPVHAPSPFRPLLSGDQTNSMVKSWN